MNWELLHVSTLEKTALGSLIALAWKYREEVIDFLAKHGGRFWRKCFPGHGLQQLSAADVLALRKAGLEKIVSMLYILADEYKADRVSLTEYVEQKDGSALGTCLREVRSSQMKSVEDMDLTPISRPLWQQIKALEARPGRELYVADAQTSDSAVVRVALTNSGACSGYYQLMPLSEKKSTKEVRYQLLAVSWEKTHKLTPRQLEWLHFSGLAFGAVLENTVPTKKTSAS